MQKCKFEFYDIVFVDSNKQNLQKINGKKGVIRGKSQSEEDPKIFAYAVDILDQSGKTESGWFIFEEDLKSTNKKANPKYFMTEETIKVRVNPETGEGEIVDKDESKNAD